MPVTIIMHDVWTFSANSLVLRLVRHRSHPKIIDGGQAGPPTPYPLCLCSLEIFFRISPDIIVQTVWNDMLKKVKRYDNAMADVINCIANELWYNNNDYNNITKLWNAMLILSDCHAIIRSTQPYLQLLHFEVTSNNVSELCLPSLLAQNKSLQRDAMLSWHMLSSCVRLSQAGKTAKGRSRKQRWAFFVCSSTQKGSSKWICAVIKGSSCSSNMT